MPTFIPPLVEGDASVGGSKHPLWRHYGNYQASATVWRDPSGTYHSTLYPYQGGGQYRSFYGGELISDTTDDVNLSLANATEVYHGGSSHLVSDAKAAELRAAGYFVGGHWESEEDKWTAYALSSANNEGFKLGDATASINPPSGGISLWSHADTGVGAYDADGYFIDPIVIVKNSLIHRDKISGAITGQTYAGAPPSAAWNHPSTAFTVMDMVLMGGGSETIVALGWSEPTNFGVPLEDGLLLTLNVFTGADTYFSVPTNNAKFLPMACYNDVNFHYILGREPDLRTNQYFDIPMFNSGNIREYVRLARAPIGQITNVGTWQYWDGDAWVSDIVAATSLEHSRLQDAQGFQLEGLTDLTKVGNDYILCQISNRSASIRMYKSTNIEGPYTFYHLADNPDRAPDKGPSPPLGYKYWSGWPKFHEYLAPDANHLVVSHSHQIFTPLITATLGPVHASIRVPSFVFVPVPSIVPA